jgi:hypothetical protein
MKPAPFRFASETALPAVSLKTITVSDLSIVVIAVVLIVLVLILVRFAYLLISKSKVAPIIEIGRFKIDFRSLGGDARDKVATPELGPGRAAAPELGPGQPEPGESES